MAVSDSTTDSAGGAKPDASLVDSPRPVSQTGRAPTIVLVLVACTVVLFLRVRDHPFVNYDDAAYVTHNDHVKSGLNRRTVLWAFTTDYAANWHPLTWLSHAADYEMFGDNPAGHHDVNLLLHAINVALLFWVLFTATGYVGRSGMVAALFALHPINVETVVWIAERKNLLSMLFFLLALGAYNWYASAAMAGVARRIRIARYLAVVVLFALALMAKPQVVSFPFVLLLWDYWPLGRVKTAAQRSELLFLILEKIPLLLLSVGSSLLTVWAQWNFGGFNPDYSFFVRSENAVVSYVRYIGKAFWPSHLAPMYPHPGTSLKTWQAGLAVLVLAGISAVVVWARDRRYLTVGWLWFLGTLVPMIGVVQVGRQAMADRYAYLPFIGLFIMICWGVSDFAEQRRISRTYLAVASCAVLLALTAATRRQIGYWGDNITLWKHTIEVTRPNYEAEEDLAEALQKENRVDEAEVNFLRAAAINPSYPRTLMYLAVHDQREGNLIGAIEKYKRVISKTDNAVHQNATIRAMAFGNMGDAYRRLGDLEEARSCLESAVALNQLTFQVWMDLGLVSQKLGGAKRAAEAYGKAMQIEPYDVGYLLLARALQDSGEKAAADAAVQRAKLLTHNYEEAQRMAAAMLAH
jgi:protein O-mannosyl-transferase